MKDKIVKQDSDVIVEILAKNNTPHDILASPYVELDGKTVMDGLSVVFTGRNDTYFAVNRMGLNLNPPTFDCVEPSETSKYLLKWKVPKNFQGGGKLKVNMPHMFQPVDDLSIRVVK